MRHKSKIGYMAVPGYVNRQTARVEWEVDSNGEFTMSGSIGRDCCGQCIDTIADAFPDNEQMQRMRAVWERWHLNHMRAHCIHQTARWDEQRYKNLTVATYKLHMFIVDEQRHIKADLITGAINKGGHTLTEHEQFILSLPYEVKVPAEERYAYMRAGFNEWYRWDSDSTKNANWCREHEHPEGLLSKKCPVCGYKAGSAWLKEELPADVLAEIASWIEEV